MSSAGLARSTRNSEILKDVGVERGSRRTRVQEKTETNAFPQIEANPFHAVIFNTELSQEERQNAITGLMTTTMETKKDRERVREFEEFREWLAAQTTHLSKEVIGLTNVDTMSEMQMVIDEMNGDLINFEELMVPVMNIIESVYKLRTNGLIPDAYKEIRDQKEREARIAAEIAEKTDAISKLQSENRGIRDENIALAQTRTMFGLGGPSQETRTKIARNEALIYDNDARVIDLKVQISELSKPGAGGTDFGEDAVHVTRLRELLDLSNEENKDRMIGLREAATKFIKTAEQRTGSLRNQFGKMSEQVDRVQDANANVSKVYGILYEGLRNAELKNSELRHGFASAGLDETPIQTLQRQEKLRSIDSHVEMVKMSEADTLATFSDMHQQAIRIETMRGGINQQRETARKLNTQGVAATADRLATVLTAVSGAALGEAAAVAGDTLQRMRNSTNEVASREVIRVAMGVEQLNDTLSMLVDEMEDMSEIQRHATGIVRQGTIEMNERMVEMRERANQLREDLAERIGVASEVSSGAGGGAIEAPKAGGVVAAFQNV